MGATSLSARLSKTRRPPRFPSTWLLRLAVGLALVHPLSAETRLSHRLDLEWAYDRKAEATQKGELVYQPRLESQLSQACDFLFQARLRADTEDVLEPGVPEHPTYSDLSERWFIGTQADAELRELWLRCGSAHFFLTLGKQQVVWGKADGLKILDVVNPQSFREFILDEFEDSRIPLWTVNAEVAFGNTNLQLLFLPDTTFHELPVPGSPFEFTSPLLVPPLPPGLPVEVLALAKPDDALDDADWGARLSTLAGGWDLSVSFLYHYEDFPVFRQDLAIGFGGPIVRVTPTYARSDLYGLTLSNAFGSLTMRGEVGYSLDKTFSAPLSAAAPDGLVVGDQVGAVLGLDWYGIGNDLLSFQVFYDRLLDEELALLLPRPEDDTIVTGLYRFVSGGERLTLELFALHDLESDDGLVRPRLHFAWSDHGAVYLAGDVFYGDQPGLFGQYDERDRVRLGLRFDY